MKYLILFFIFATHNLMAYSVCESDDYIIKISETPLSLSLIIPKTSETITVEASDIIMYDNMAVTYDAVVKDHAEILSFTLTIDLLSILESGTNLKINTKSDEINQTVYCR